ncbi:NADH dehydrogenase [ubiquinone] 1 beta subcomplex subunit 3 [Daktulosphaira vitifoliae]|uniref:NADH dehydrogenase [ubiquinone] 1 beta subcomplex subunit 3 n=1 Tax=Daktulosphaira vitifoliae TaxID=58002 RepID=UPI0021AA2719|nr:NADH dehydrogenase [ubiquinone] 1 beta subcomplex subunit 3 [Daktulosphaira vitifoliae]
MGGHNKIEIPDYRIYKVENVPELMKVKAILATEDLKDPWLRNEVWRYPPNRGSAYAQYFKCWFRGKRGLTIAFGLAATVIGIEKTYNHFFPAEHHHKKLYYPSSSIQ